ncbi:tetratricopeptide repeat protein [Oleiharenicola lentus]|uniref:tetratricopeptide repeat protein n=1 Tax=Oleiharenicola lentus TaxID=2508720 RepID=UPI003F67F220
MFLPRPLIVGLWFIPTLLLAESPYQYRYGSAAYENAVRSNAYNDRINAPVTNRGGYTPDFSNTIAEIRKTMGTKPKFDRRTGRERYQDEQSERDAYDWVKSVERFAQSQRENPPPPKPSLVTVLRNEANAGNVESMRRLGILEFFAFSSNNTKASGFAWLQRAAEGGDKEARSKLLGIYLGKDAYANFPAALEILAVLALAGDRDATRQLADAYATGIPGKLVADANKARHFQELGASQGIGVCAIALARDYRDGINFKPDTPKAIATYRQLIEFQRANPKVHAYDYYTGAAGWEWFELELAANPTLAGVPAETLALWEFAVRRDEDCARSSAHRLAAALGTFYEEGKILPRDIDKAILYLSIATSGHFRNVKPESMNSVIFDDSKQARVKAHVADLLLTHPLPWPNVCVNGQILPATKEHLVQFYSEAANYAELSGQCFPHPVVMLRRLVQKKDYPILTENSVWLEWTGKALATKAVPLDPAHPDFAEYGELLYEHATLSRANSEALEPDTLHKLAVEYQQSWTYGFLPAALPLAQLIDDLRLPGFDREDAKKICRTAAEKGDVLCAAQLGTWLTGEVVAQEMPNPALVAEAKKWLAVASAAKIARATEDAAMLAAAIGDFPQSVAYFQTVLAKEPTPRSQAGFAELLATGKGGLKAEPARAFQLLREAAEQDPFHFIRIAEIIQHAQWGTTKDMNEVRELLETALYGNNQWQAGLALAKLYHDGIDLEKNEDRAFELLQAAGARGDNETARALAAAFEKGEIINRSPEDAAHWKKASIEGLHLDPG